MLRLVIRGRVDGMSVRRGIEWFGSAGVDVAVGMDWEMEKSCIGFFGENMGCVEFFGMIG